MTLATIIFIMVLVDNIGTNTFGANVLIIKLVQSDVIVLEIITSVKETILELIFPSRSSRIIIPSNATHYIFNGNTVHTNSPFYYRTEGCSEDLIISVVNFGTRISGNFLKASKLALSATYFVC